MADDGSGKSPCVDAAVAVLGSYESFTRIVCFLPGLPSRVVAFYRENGGKWSDQNTRMGMLPRLAIRVGNSDVLEALCRLHERGDCAYDGRVSFQGSELEAAACGNLQALQLLLQQPQLVVSSPSTLLDTAILHGHTPTAQWLYSMYPHDAILVSSHAIDSAAQSSRQELFEWIHTQQLAAFTSHAMDLAVQTGSLAIVKILHTHYNLQCDNVHAITTALECNFNDVLVYLAANNAIHDVAVAIQTAYTQNKTDLVRQLLYKSIEACGIRDSVAFLWAAHIGDMALLHKLWGSADIAALLQATIQGARCGHLPVVRFLTRVFPAAIQQELLNEAVHHGRLAIVTFLIQEKQLQCSDVALNLAAVHGYTELVAFLVKETNAGCLFHARRLAMRSTSSSNSREQVVVLLSDAIDPSIRFCELKLHVHGRRRCARKPTKNKNETTKKTTIFKWLSPRGED